jgi:CCR4-NOT transcription complex subunit 7/8
MRSCKSLKGGLQDVADELQVPRIGPQHQAGSDSLLTASTFFKMRSRFFEDDIDPKYLGNLYGLGSSSSQFHQTQGSGNGGSSSTPQMPSAGMPTPGGLSIASGPPIPPVASAALPIRDPFASPFKLPSGSAVSTPGLSLLDLAHTASPSPGSGLR